jgi:hypothetical protein
MTEKMVHSLGIAVYINEGRIHRVGPSERIDPPTAAAPRILTRSTASIACASVSATTTATGSPT